MALFRLIPARGIATVNAGPILGQCGGVKAGQ
jgi:hypothetical protein